MNDSDLLRNFYSVKPEYDPVASIKNRIEDKPEKKDKPFYIGDALLGAGNGLLFGIPEWIARQASGDKTVDDWKAEHESGYNAGGTVGDIASGFIPVAGLAGKALQAGKLLSKVPMLGKVGDLAAKAGKGIEGVTKMTNMGKGGLGMAVKSGVLEGAGQSALRNAFAPEDEKKDAGGVLGDALMGGALGGLGSGVGSILKKGATGGKELLKEATDQAAQALVKSNGPVGREVIRSIKKFGGDFDEQVRNLADLTHKYKTNKMMGDDEALQKANSVITGKWKKLEQDADNSPGFIQQADQRMLDKMADISDDIKANVGRRQTATAKDITDTELDDVVQDIMGKASSPQSMLQKRNYLQKVIDQNKDFHARSQDPIVEARFQTALHLKNAYDDELGKFADTIGDASLKDLKKDYRSLQIMRDAKLREWGRDLNPSSGPSTQEKMMANRLLSGEGGNILQEGAKAGLSGILGNMLAKGSEYAKNKILGSTYKGLKNLEDTNFASKIQKYENLKDVMPGAGRSVAALLQNKPADEQFQTQDKGQMAKSVADRVYSLYGGQAGDEGYEQFMAQVAPALQSNPELMYKLMGQEGIGQGSNVVDTLAQNMQEASGAHKAEGIPLIGGGLSDLFASKESKNAENQMVSALAQQLNKAMGGTQEQAKEMIKKAITGGGSSAEKMQRLLEEWGQVDPNQIMKLRNAGII